MSNKTILLTGITGFIGSNLAQVLLEHNYKIIALIQKTSNLERCNFSNLNNVIYCEFDSPTTQEIIIENKPETLIHIAWAGVSASERNDWKHQVKNLNILINVLELSKNCTIKKIISFGSQAEYGIYTGRISEDAVPSPINAYAAIKVACQTILSTYCTENNIDWHWFRLFSIFGPKENDNWFIPSVINNALNNIPMKLTGCRQKYDYLYIMDLCDAIIKVINTNNSSGIYNLSSNSSVELIQIVEIIQNLTNSKADFQFGVLPYRENQVMHMEGDSEKFYKTFKFKIDTKLKDSILATIKYYKQKNDRLNVAG